MRFQTFVICSVVAASLVFAGCKATGSLESQNGDAEDTASKNANVSVEVMEADTEASVTNMETSSGLKIEIDTSTAGNVVEIPAE